MSWGVIDLGTSGALKQTREGGADIPKNIFTSGPDYFEKVMPQMDRHGLKNAIPALNQAIGDLLHEIHEASLIALEDIMMIAPPVTLAEEVSEIDYGMRALSGSTAEGLFYHSTLSPEKLIAAIKKHVMNIMNAVLDSLPAERRDEIMARLDTHKKNPGEAIAAAMAEPIRLNPDPNHGFAEVDFLSDDEKLLVHSIAGPSVRDVNLLIGSSADSVIWRSKLSYPSLRSDMATATNILVANRCTAEIRDIIERVVRARKKDDSSRVQGQYEDLVVIPLIVPERETAGLRYPPRYSTLHPEDLIEKVQTNMEWHLIALALAALKTREQTPPAPPSSPLQPKSPAVPSAAAG